MTVPVYKQEQLSNLENEARPKLTGSYKKKRVVLQLSKEDLKMGVSVFGTLCTTHKLAILSKEILARACADFVYLPVFTTRQHLT